ncbi:hypothetical protein FM737_000848 [Escherichia marmotae]|nr:hypothetical protein A1SC_03997 [Escherichia sp. KTE52]KAF3714058.1 hypothetical protein FM737_000848 [Escherichia marmotae]VEF95547.1 Uncharacterised protein [Escherichia marmotae]
MQLNIHLLSNVVDFLRKHQQKTKRIPSSVNDYNCSFFGIS